MNAKYRNAFLSVVICLSLVLTMGRVILPKKTYAKTERLSGLSAQQIVSRMGFGWNLGNTLDATGGRASDPYSQETSWGNPRVTKELIKAVHEAGFDTIRIPITWNNYLSKDGSFKINEAYFNRVQEIVDYAYDEGMFVIINVHHESWVNDKNLDKNFEKIGDQLSAVWYQIADRFADYDQHLIFEGMNEPRKAGTTAEWSGDQASYEAVNYLTQVFVNTVRMSDKGNNYERCLMIPGYAASNSYNIMNTITLPTYQGETAKNLIISVHSYAPYNFCLQDTMRDFDPAKSECTTEIDGMFENLSELFLSQGIPVVIGETSATSKNNTEARERWAYYMGKKAAGYGVPIIIWDNGNNSNSGGESHAYINRKDNTWNYKTVIDAFMKAKDETVWASMVKPKEDQSQNTNTFLGGTIMWENKAGVASKKEWDNSYIQFAAKDSFFKKGCEIGVVYTGSSDVKIILDSEQAQAWWIMVEPYKTETKDGKKVSYFTYDMILSAMKSNGVSSFAQLRNFCIITTGTDAKTYEIETIGGTSEVTYIVFGATYATGNALPAQPSYKNLTFLGWYETKDYKNDTVYTGNKEGVQKVYAKFGLAIDLKEGLEKKGLLGNLQTQPSVPETMEETKVSQTPQETVEETTQKETKEEISSSKEETQTKSEIKEEETTTDNSKVLVCLLVIAALVAVFSGTFLFLRIKKLKK